MGVPDIVNSSLTILDSNPEGNVSVFTLTPSPPYSNTIGSIG